MAALSSRAPTSSATSAKLTRSSARASARLLAPTLRALRAPPTPLLLLVIVVLVLVLVVLVLRCHRQVPHNSIEMAERSHQAIITKEGTIH